MVDSLGDVEQWMSHYYRDPRPDLVPLALRALGDRGQLDSEATAVPISVFFSLVFQAHTDRLAGWEAELGDLMGRPVIAHALTLCTAGDWPDTLLTMQVEDPADLDALWAGFLATGDERYVGRVIDTLAVPEALGAAARWSLEANAPHAPACPRDLPA